MDASVSVPVPPQYEDQVVFDFRGATSEPRGYKAKRKREVDELEEQAQNDAAAYAMSEPAPLPPQKKLKVNTLGVGKASGRPWKEPGQRAGSLQNPRLSSSWAAKMQAKADRSLFQAQRQEAIGAHKEKLVAERKRREAVKKRKEENKQKSAVVQKISSHATLRKMMKSKKQRKKLQMADTN